MRNRGIEPRRSGALLALAACGLTVFLGCAATSERKTAESDDDTEGLRRYEKSFNPVDYDPDLPAGKEPEAEKKQPTRQPGGIIETGATGTEVVPGFRVQVTFTENIEQANRIREEVSAQTVDQPVYVVFEAPYYKVRVGDFQNRPEANLTLRSLFEKGYKDSWIVPDKVKKE